MIWISKILSFVSKHHKLIIISYNIIKNLINYLKVMGQKGLWSKDAEKGFSQFIDDKVDLTKLGKFGWAFESVDGFLVNQGITYLDNSYSDKIPAAFEPTYIKIGKVFEEYKTNKELILSDFITHEEIAVIVDTLIDIPKVSDETEAIFFAGIMKAIFDVVGKIVDK